jgi:hypothetical protein
VAEVVKIFHQSRTISGFQQQFLLSFLILLNSLCLFSVYNVPSYISVYIF